MLDLSDIPLSKIVGDLLVRFAEKSGGKVLGVIGNTTSKLKDALTVNYSRYFETVIDRCSHVSTLFDRSKPMTLSSIYVPIILSFSGSRVSDEKFRDLLATLPSNDSLRMFLISGTAGAGKTFLLRWLFLTLLENAGPRIPLYLELRGINNQADTDFIRFVYNTI